MPPRSHPAAQQPAMPGFADAFVTRVLDDALGHGCRCYGIAGLQGTGKSTLSAQMATLAAGRGLLVSVLSIDDFYLSHLARLDMSHRVHPLCATRGVPGTHDVALACEVIDALRNGRPTALPQFDKIADDCLPRSQWPVVEQADLVILEGWFLKVPAQTAAELLEPINPLERDEDPEGIWRHWSNTALAAAYPTLWARLDRLLFLQGPGFEIVPHWRWQQEQTLQSANPNRRAMTRGQVDRFVQFFERDSQQAMKTLPGISDRTIHVDAERHPIDAKRDQQESP